MLSGFERRSSREIVSSDDDITTTTTVCGEKKINKHFSCNRCVRAQVGGQHMRSKRTIDSLVRAQYPDSSQWNYNSGWSTMVSGGGGGESECDNRGKE